MGKHEKLITRLLSLPKDFSYDDMVTFMNTLSYKDYIGSVSYSAEDEVFFGKIEHIHDLITFESDNAHDLKRVFKEAVDDYIKFCKEKGIEPEKPFKGSFNVRLRPSLHKRAYQKARESGMSLNQFIEATLEKELGKG